LRMRRAPRVSTLFPYTTLFRSHSEGLPGPDAACADGVPVELITAREVPLGGPRAMLVRRTLPQRQRSLIGAWCFVDHYGPSDVRSEEHTSELQSRFDLVCRLLL